MLVLSPLTLPSLAITAGSTAPNPGTAGALAWSTTLAVTMQWNGTSWQLFSSSGSTVTKGLELAVRIGAFYG